jgi:hypothetical protein
VKHLTRELETFLVLNMKLVTCESLSCTQLQRNHSDIKWSATMSFFVSLFQRCFRLTRSRLPFFQRLKSALHVCVCKETHCDNMRCGCRKAQQPCCSVCHKWKECVQCQNRSTWSWSGDDEVKENERNFPRKTAALDAANRGAQASHTSTLSSFQDSRSCETCRHRAGANGRGT